ncbi:MAG: right-handed parallel beta-helix repeat-containing protein [Kiritimatiellae bacterium]|nr:right-handed parallel beta-helix repeat-containing protein [Kiritimatiellia bacterium]
MTHRLAARTMAVVWGWLLLATGARAREIPVPPAGDWSAALNALQPGDVALLQKGRYQGIARVSVKGTAAAPITIRGAGPDATVLDGAGRHGAPLTLDGCAHVVVENLTLANASPYGIDGRTTYDHRGDKKKYPKKKICNEGVVLRDCERITVRHCRFADIATRGILAGNTDGLLVEENLFVNVGDDTAGGDVGLGGRTRRWTIRHNLFAGNVDGVVCHGAGSEGLIERNLFMFHKWEDAIDLKKVTKKDDEDYWTTVRYNIIYADQTYFSGVTLQNGSQGIRVYYNAIRGQTGLHREKSQPKCLMIQSRSHTTGRKDTCKDYVIAGNWFDAFDRPGEGSAVNSFRNSRNPADLESVWILHNVMTGFKDAVQLRYGKDVGLYNNVFVGCTPAVSVEAKGGGNLYRGAEPWTGDSAPLVTEHRATDASSGAPPGPGPAAGPLPANAPGTGKAVPVNGLSPDCGRDIGIPRAIRIAGATFPFEPFDELEASILHRLEKHFSREQIKPCMDIGKRPY